MFMGIYAGYHKGLHKQWCIGTFAVALGFISFLDKTLDPILDFSERKNTNAYNIQACLHVHVV